MAFRLRALLAVITLAPAVMLLDTSASSLSSSAAEIQLQLADLLFEEGRYNEALDAYEQARAAPDPPQQKRASMGVVRAALRTAEFTRARAESAALAEAHPEDPELLALHADALWSSGLFEESERTHQASLAMDPDNARARHGLARALSARNQLAGALEQVQAGLALAPRDPELYHTVGSIYERMHRFEDAAVAFGNYVNLLPNKDRSVKAAWSRAEIRFLRSFGDRVPFQVVGGEEQVHTVPFRLVRDKVVVRVSLNGGPLRDLVLDTGAEQTVLSRRTAQRAGVRPVVYTLSAGVGDVGLRGLQVGRLDSIKIGTLEVRNVPCLIKSPGLEGMPTREPDTFSPLALGLSMTIDYERRQLQISKRLRDTDAQIELPLRMHRLAVVRGTVNGEPTSFVVDTGGEVISISASTAESVGPSEFRRIPLKVYGTSGWDSDAFLLPGIELRFDRLLFPNTSVVVLNLRAPSALLGFQVGGIVGHKFLSRYKVGFDLERSVLTLRQLSAAG